MLKLFTKKWIFFLVSFSIIFVAGFFIWNIFISSDNGVMNRILGEVNKISSKFFPASISQNFGTTNIIPAIIDNQNKVEQDLAPDENLLDTIDSQNQVVIGPKGYPEDSQDQLDDIQEKLDIIKQIINDLLLENSEAQTPDLDQIQDLNNQKPDGENNQDQNQDNNQNDNQNIDNTNIINNIRGGSAIIYPKILISEVQIAGASDDKQEFVELYNPNSQAINLTGWYLQRKTASSQDWSTYASNNLFSGKTIFANGYFLIARTGYYSTYADIFTDNPITNDNSFALKNPNGDISDKLGFGQAEDPELLSTQNPSAGQSVGRKVLSDQTEEETDNNLNDFELQTPTPKAQNITYVVPPAQGGGGGGGGPAPVVYPKILISEVRISPIDQRFIELYNPNDKEVSLTDWYIQRKDGNDTSWGTFISHANFEGKTIPQKGYFLIIKEPVIADLQFDLTLTDNNSLVLKNPNQDISDQLKYSNALDNNLYAQQNSTNDQTIGRKVLIDNSEQDTDNDFVDFELQTPTPKTQNIKWIELSAPTDTTPPEVNFILDSIQNNLNFTISFTITDLIGTVSPSGIGSYVFQWQEDGGDWQQDLPIEIIGSPASANFSRSFTGEDGKTYYFQLQATDVAGNISEWLPEPPATTTVAIPILTKAILINEIQINPIEQRFVEFYNPNDYEIDLTDWYIQRKTQNADSWGSFVSSTNFQGKTIPANGYFLISRQIENSDILLNITLSDNNSLALKNPNRDIVDKVG